MLKKVDNDIGAVNNTNDEIKRLLTDDSSSDQIVKPTVSTTFTHSMANLHAKLDHISKIQSDLINQNSSSMLDKLSNLQTKMDSISSINSSTSKFMPSTTNSSLKKPTVHTPCVIDPLNWSFSFNQSVINNENSDLYHLLHGFEQNTWASFDHLFRKLSENTEAVLHIESVCKQLIDKDTTHQLRSPVVDSVALDNLQQINEKCDNIEKNLMEVDSNVKILCSDLNIDDQLTQQLRTRFMALIDQTTTGNTSSTNFNLPITNNLSQCPVIDELSMPSPVMSNTINNSSSNIVNCNSTVMKSLHLLGGRVNIPTLDKHFHISPLDIDVTPCKVIDFIADNTQIDRKHIKVRRLTKKGQDISALKHVNFKIETNEEIASVIIQKNFWPSHITIKPWTSKIVIPEQTTSFLLKN